MVAGQPHDCKTLRPVVYSRPADQQTARGLLAFADSQALSEIVQAHPVSTPVVPDLISSVRENVPVNRFCWVVWTVGIGHADKANQTSHNKAVQPTRFICSTVLPFLRHLDRGDI